MTIRSIKHRKLFELSVFLASFEIRKLLRDLKKTAFGYALKRYPERSQLLTILPPIRSGRFV